MKRVLAVLLVLGTLALVLILLPRGEDDLPTGTVHREPEVPAPLPGYREEAASLPKNAKPEARLRGRPPAGEARHLLVEVVDPDGEPVPQALLIVERGADEDWREWVESVAAGRAHVAGPRGAETMNLDVTDLRDAEGNPLALLPRRVEGIRPGQTEVAIELRWSRRLSGTVRDTDGDPVPGVSIRAAPPARFSAGREAVTDEDGRFEIVGLPPGYLSARLRKNDVCVGPSAVSIEANQTHVDVEVDPLVSFTFTVVDPDDEPVAGVDLRVRWVAQTVPQDHAGVTDEEGRLVIPSVPRSATLYARTAWHDEGPRFPDTGAAEIPAADGAFRFRLSEPLTIEGILEHGDGASVVGGWVTLQYVPERGARMFWLRGDDTVHVKDGTFRFERVPPGRYVLRGGAYGGGTSEEVDVRAPAHGVRIVLPTLVTLEGRVLAETPTDVIVQWFAGTDRPRLAKVAPDGAFAISCPADVEGTLYAFDRTTFAACLLEGILPSGGPYEVTCGVAHEISGRVPDYTKRGWFPDLHAVRGPVRIPARIRDDGSFVLHALPPGAWRLEWGGGPGPIKALDVRSGDTGLVVPQPSETLPGR